MTNQFTDEQAIAAALSIRNDYYKPKFAADFLDDEREFFVPMARAALEAAAGAAPQAEGKVCCAHPKCPGGSLCCCPALPPSSTVDEGELEHRVEEVIRDVVDMPLSSRLVLARAVVEAIGGEGRAND